MSNYELDYYIAGGKVRDFILKYFRDKDLLANVAQEIATPHGLTPIWVGDTLRGFVVRGALDVGLPTGSVPWELKHYKSLTPKRGDLKGAVVYAPHRGRKAGKELQERIDALAPSNRWERNRVLIGKQMGINVGPGDRGGDRLISPGWVSFRKEGLPPDLFAEAARVGQLAADVTEVIVVTVAVDRAGNHTPVIDSVQIKNSLYWRLKEAAAEADERDKAEAEAKAAGAPGKAPPPDSRFKPPCRLVGKAERMMNTNWADVEGRRAFWLGSLKKGDAVEVVDDNGDVFLTTVSGHVIHKDRRFELAPQIWVHGCSGSFAAARMFKPGTFGEAHG